MKKLLLVGSVVFFGATSSLFAMESMSGDTMMKHDNTMMVSDSMMKDDSMMKKDTMMDYKKLTVAQIAKKMGYNWIKDRKMLAMKAGITGYRGTAAQNLKIKAYLMSMSADSMMK